MVSALKFQLPRGKHKSFFDFGCKKSIKYREQNRTQQPEFYANIIGEYVSLTDYSPLESANPSMASLAAAEALPVVNVLSVDSMETPCSREAPSTLAASSGGTSIK